MRMKISKGTVIRTTILIIAIINNALALFNKSPLPIDDETVKMVVTFLFTTGSALVAWWKNNSFTTPAILADDFKEAIKAKEKEMRFVEPKDGQEN